MKAIICEMCEGRDLVKQDGYYVCQSCGTKYSMEEAKNLMVEVSGTVKVDRSDYLGRILENARQALKREDWREVETCYNMVKQDDPNNIEAIFFSAYGKARTTLSNKDLYEKKAAFNVLENCMDAIYTNFDIDRSGELKAVIMEISQAIVNLQSCEFVYSYTENGYGQTVTSDAEATRSLFSYSMVKLEKVYEKITQKYANEDSRKIQYIYQIRLQLLEMLMKLGFKGVWFVEKCIEITNVLRQIDPSQVFADYSAKKEEMLKVEASKSLFTKIGLIAAILTACPIIFNFFSGYRGLMLTELVNFGTSNDKVLCIIMLVVGTLFVTLGVGLASHEFVPGVYIFTFIGTLASCVPVITVSKEYPFLEYAFGGYLYFLAIATVIFSLVMMKVQDIKFNKI